MINRALKSKIFSRFSLAAVMLALITLSIIQYHWLTSSAEKDLTELYRSFSYRIFSAISEEFSLFPLPGDRLNFLREANNEEELKEVIVNLYNKLKTTDNYINSISYLKYSENKKHYMLYSEKGWDNKKTAPIELNFDRRGFSLIPDTTDKGQVWITIPIEPINENTRIYILFHFNILSFYKNKVEVSLSSMEDSYELRWHYDISGKRQIIDSKDYQYSPFRVLKNKLFSTESPWFIEIPLHVIIFNNRYNRMDKIFFEPKPEEENRRPSLSAYVDVYYNGKPLIQSKEYALTLRWLLSLLLILGIGTAYLVILYQINKLKQLSLREKEFVASITHELRTPLTVIHSAADNIKSGIISSERIEQYGQLITDQSIRLSSMIEGILLSSRLEGKAEKVPQLKTVSFSKLNNHLDIYAQSIMKDKIKHIKIDFGSLPDSAITDIYTLELILTNLIKNSWGHAYEPNKLGEIRIKGHLKLPELLIFIVEDDGFGIEKGEKKHIFQPFYRGSRSTENQIKGSGLGLYLSYRKARLIGGSLKLESPYPRIDGKVKKGCRFILKVPYIPVENGTAK
ncbi:MAG: hypothetical protein DRP58_07040 [Spirochaetes bacterium]|nr:MAG: hypothetical protein DRP58_07040 [Spirochaetota bacterium]